jgi:ligand-binding SRPBCC domain-containing protein
MKTHHLKSELWLPRPRDQVFQFFADPRNLERITPPWLSFEILTPPEIEITQGTLLDYRLKLRGIPLRWRSEITIWEPPRRFVDRQTQGPYSLWVHEHRFTDEDSGTIVGDHVEYAVLGGRLIQEYLVAPDLERIFNYRRQALKELLNAA